MHIQHKSTYKHTALIYVKTKKPMSVQLNYRNHFTLSLTCKQLKKLYTSPYIIYVIVSL